MAVPTLTEEQAAQIVETAVTSFIDRKGVSEVTFADQSTRWEPLKDTIAAINEVTVASSGSRTRYASTSKGV